MSLHKGDPKDVFAIREGGCLMLGYFDGVHIGHQELAKEAQKLAKELGDYPGAFTFNGKLYTKSIPMRAMISTANEKCQLLEHFGLEEIYLVDFTDCLRDLQPEEFVKTILHDHLKCKAVVIGPSFTFGKGGLGKPDLLLCECEKLGIICKVIPEVIIDGESVSSSRIRNILFEGDIANANRLLGHKFTLHGNVVHGVGIGKQLGFPTANIDIPNPMKIVPGGGVYACFSYVQGVRYKSAVSIGSRPTFLGGDRSLESHILDFDQNIYDCDIRLEFVEKVRDQIKFESRDQLIVQIGKDVEKIRNILGGAL
jgi:riboflavin kinase/FMN adenylyltransferase